MPPHIRYVFVYLFLGYELFYFSQCISSYNLCIPSIQDWSLELEEVFSLEREGEFDKFAPYREKLGNRMLLWHGRFWCY